MSTSEGGSKEKMDKKEEQKKRKLKDLSVSPEDHAEKRKNKEFRKKSKEHVQEKDEELLEILRNERESERKLLESDDTEDGDSTWEGKSSSSSVDSEDSEEGKERREEKADDRKSMKQKEINELRNGEAKIGMEEKLSKIVKMREELVKAESRKDEKEKKNKVRLKRIEEKIGKIIEERNRERESVEAMLKVWEERMKKRGMVGSKNE